MRQYVYVSTAENLASQEVTEILESCNRNNPFQGLTGLLLYNGRNFLQVLEGEHDSLERVMRRIEHDSRHHGISRLHDEPIDDRTCPDWSMRRLALGEPGDSRRERLETELPVSLDPLVRRMILNFAMLN
ncbi:MAG: BLUF domain-containing protein [Sphingomonadaceae bacterium]